MKNGNRMFLGAGLLGLLGFQLGWMADHIVWSGSALVLSLAALAVYFQRHPKLNILAFTFWVFTMTCWALYSPAGSSRSSSWP